MTCLVLLPGMDGTGLLFSAFAAALGDRIKPAIIAYPSKHVLDYAQLESYVRERLPLNETFVLLGESFSGPMAVSIAADPPRNLTGLILCCSFARNPRPALAALKAFTNLMPGLKSTTLASPFMLGNYSTPALRRQLDDALAQVPSAVMRARLRAVLEIDVTTLLPQVRVPVLYLCGTHDRLVPESAGTLIASRALQTQIVRVDGPHMLLQAVPVVTASIVRKFIEQERNAT